MGDISQGRELSGYQSPESRRLEAVERRLGIVEGEVDRLLKYAEARAQERAESSRRMMRALNGAIGEE